MEPASIHLAKLTQPRLQKILPRKRLFQLLDENRVYPSIWISGPGGSGKTTLTASYIETRELPCLWYQIDAGDADIATFFYYLGLAGKKLAPEKEDLPLLTSEYALGISTFTKRFFEKLFARLTQPGVVILDNYQDVPLDSRFHQVISDALSVIPEGVHLFILSRTSPPPRLAKAKANSLLQEIAWPALRLQAKETRELVALLSRKSLSDELIESLHQKTDGWVAGLLLLLKRAETELIDPGAFTEFTTREVFDYFTSEIFEKADKEIQDFLLTTSVTPLMTAQMASRLSGGLDAEQIFSQMLRRHWFITRYPGNESKYQYHPLFREFLLRRAEQSYSPEQMKKIKEEAARLMQKDGQAEQAVELLLESGNLHEALHLILNQAQRMTIQGRFQTLMQWLRRLPDQYLRTHPQILYWMGVCRYRMDPYEGRELFEKAFALFEEQNEISGICLALSGVLDAITYGFNTLKPVDQWIPKLASLSQGYDKLPSAAIKGQLAASALFALTLRKPEHPEFKSWEERGIALLQEKTAPPHIKLRIIMTLITHRTMTGELTEADYFINQYRLLTQSPNIPPYALISLSLLEACYYFAAGFFEQCRQAVHDVLSLAEKTGVHVFSPLALGHGAAGELSAGNLDYADKQLKRMIQYSNSGNWIIEYYHTLSIWKALLEEDDPKALLHAERAAEYVEKAGVRLSAPICFLGVAHGRKKAGDADKSQKALDRAVSISNRIGTWQVQFACYLARAEFALNSKDFSAARNALQKALSIGREKQYFNTWFWRRDSMARLCCKALESEIEVAYVQDLIRKRNIAPESPPVEIENWPWPIRIYTLGRFNLVKDGKPMVFKGKGGEKPLALLKTIISFGGRHVSEHQISDFLWPEADGDVAHGTFKTTLHRLRKLIGQHEAIQLNAGSVSLDERYCWVDAWSFARKLSEADRIWQAAPREEKNLQKAAGLTESALNLYKGRLFQSEEDMAISLRDHLHYRFIQALHKLGKYWQGRSEWEKAINLYEMGVKIDQQVESFYRELMFCNYQLGRKARALAAYNRCKKTISENLDATISEETEDLKASLLKR